jgi:membrane fusion protein, multidrug efflux system
MSTVMEAPSTPPPKKKKAPLVLGALLVVAAIVAGIIYITRLGKEKTDDAQVEGHVATVSARVAGQVKRVAIDDNQIVKKGDVLIELDDRDQQVRVAAARADLAATQAQLRQAQTQLAMTDKTAKANLAVAKGGIAQAAAVTGSTQAMIDQAKADVSAAESRKQLTKLDRDRYEKMLAGGAVAKAEVDARVAADTQADAQLATAKARLVTAEANRSNSSGTAESAQGKFLAASTVDEQLELARAQVALNESRVAQSQAALDRALLDLEYTKIKAEIDGTIARRSVEPGQMVGPDRPLAAIVDLADTWVVANLKETQLDDVKAGQTVDISIDTYGGELHGKVDSIAAGTGSRFSLLPPDNASGNFIKVTQRVPVKIKLDDRAGKILRPGMSADVTIHTK